MEAVKEAKTKPVAARAGMTAGELRDHLGGRLHPGSTLYVRLEHVFGTSLVPVRDVRITLGKPGEPDLVELLT